MIEAPAARYRRLAATETRGHAPLYAPLRRWEKLADRRDGRRHVVRDTFPAGPDYEGSAGVGILIPTRRVCLLGGVDTPACTTKPHSTTKPR